MGYTFSKKSSQMKLIFKEDYLQTALGSPTRSIFTIKIRFYAIN